MTDYGSKHEVATLVNQRLVATPVRLSINCPLSGLRWIQKYLYQYSWLPLNYIVTIVFIYYYDVRTFDLRHSNYDSEVKSSFKSLLKLKETSMIDNVFKNHVVWTWMCNGQATWNKP